MYNLDDIDFYKYTYCSKNVVVMNTVVNSELNSYFKWNDKRILRYIISGNIGIHENKFVTYNWLSKATGKHLNLFY